MVIAAFSYSPRLNRLIFNKNRRGNYDMINIFNKVDDIVVVHSTKGAGTSTRTREESPDRSLSPQANHS